jgi:monomeric sarcosine oxidase
VAAAYYATQAAQRVLLLEGFPLIDNPNSSHGDSRMFRIMYSDENMARLAMASEPLWRALEREAGEALLDTSAGCLFYGLEGRHEKPEGDIARCMEVMDALAILYTKYDAAGLSKAFPVFKAQPEAYVGVWQADGGPAYAERTLRAFARLSTAAGATLRDREPVVDVIPGGGNGDPVQVVTTQGSYLGRKLILAPGAYANSVLAPFGIQIALQIWEVTTAFYQVQTPHEYPIWICFGPAEGDDGGVYYGFPPILGTDRVKIGLNFTRRPIYSSPNQCPHQPDLAGLAYQSRFIARTFHGIDPQHIPGTEDTCTFNMTQDTGFVLDFVPGHPNVVIFTGDSGHAFKFTPLIGSILADLVLTGKTAHDIRDYAITRPGIMVNATPPGVTAPGHPSLVSPPAQEKTY